MAAITPERRRELAALIDCNEQYLYQCLTGRREMSAAEARTAETKTDGELRRWALCQHSWHRIWPELIAAEGAPEVPAATEQGA
jgi:DNA-binding transcriptional regulator YdaS (Cro superfamily)